ncbi:prepilin-type N-terminal cleavage/methylation domain-containing protein [Nocardioides baekrokdamisoli]|uniref:prepilin-type N-terminal cleavage/methylation domain-containing protein n=1 Tax=Nocardioides baekrokdamisoli TaxID=1804624 RepID=UPI0013DDAFA4|nr:prepilin-type N-terminal cleavage/methylation domain-containing protein [Nocardioides baekrokdamisoli]
MRPTDDHGETLIELLVAVVIIGIGAIAILGGFEFSIKASVLGRNQATSDAYVRTLAEKIQNTLNTSGTYKTCASATQYLTASVKSVLPTGFTATSTAAKIWNGSGWTSTCSAATDTGVQLVVLTVTSTGTGVHQANEKLTVVLRKPCNTGPYSAASKC